MARKKATNAAAGGSADDGGKEGGKEGGQAVREAEALPTVEAAGATAEAVADGRSSDGNDDGSQEDSRRAWTLQEDELIAQLVAQHGTNWALIGAQLQNRSVQQCCERYRNVINPFFRNGVPWTRAEDLAIVAAQHKLANHWTAIAQHVPGRTATAICNRWNSTLLNKREGLLAAALLAAAANPAEGASQSSSPAPAQTMHATNSKLTDDDARRIFEARSPGTKGLQARLAREFSISERTVDRIWKRRTRRVVTEYVFKSTLCMACIW
jgi:hypothetical protein